MQGKDVTNTYSITNAFITVNTWVDTNSGSGTSASMITINPSMCLAIIIGLIVIVALTAWLCGFKKPSKF